jgi:hypothetical protein
MNIEISPKKYESKLNWYDGMLYCQLLIIDGKDDWRLPTKDELDYIYHSENDFVFDFYWTSTEYNGHNAWSQNLSSGNQYDFSYKNYSYYVRPVRTIKY